MLIRVVDTETSGLPTADEPHAVVEVAYVDIQDGEIVESNSWLCDPGRPIDIAAMAVHHLTDAMVAGKPPFRNYAEILREGSTDYFAAHNSRFDRQFFDREFPDWDTPWLCTLKIARRLWPECPSHANQALRYYLGLDVPQAIASMAPHRALPDAYVTALILKEAMQLTPLPKMALWSEQPSVLRKIGFGKHRGALWRDLPSDYLRWILSQNDMGEDEKFTAWAAMIARKEFA